MFLNEIQAIFGDHVKVRARDAMTVRAVTTGNGETIMMFSIGAALAGGSAGVSGVINTLVVKNDVLAQIGDFSDITAKSLAVTGVDKAS